MSQHQLTKFIILILAFSAFAFPKNVFAQSFSLGVYPPIFQAEAEPPTTVRAPITVINQSDQNVTLKIEFRAFQSSFKENGELIYIDNDLSYQRLFKGVQVKDGDVKRSELTLSPKQKKNLTLQIVLPKDAETRDYYFSVLFVSEGSDYRDQNRSGAIGGIATNVLLSVGPQRLPSGRILDFSAPKFVTHGPVAFNVRVENESDHFVTTEGNIIIRNVFSQAIGKLNLLPINILGKTVRLIPNQEGLVKFFDAPKAVWGEKFLLGAYTADLSVSLSDQGPVLKDRTIFFAFPAEALAILLIILGIGIAIWARAKRKVDESH